jgi:hypothetical protein
MTHSLYSFSEIWLLLLAVQFDLLALLRAMYLVVPLFKVVAKVRLSRVLLLKCSSLTRCLLRCISCDTEFG